MVAVLLMMVAFVYDVSGDSRIKGNSNALVDET